MQAREVDGDMLIGMEMQPVAPYPRTLFSITRCVRREISPFVPPAGRKLSGDRLPCQAEASALAPSAPTIFATESNRLVVNLEFAGY